MMTIDLKKVPKNPDVFGVFTPRDMVKDVLKNGKEVFLILKTTKTSYTVEMKSGSWLAIPKEALIKG